MTDPRELLTLVSRKQIVSIVESQHSPISLWTGAVSSGKTVASLVAFLILLAEAPKTGLVVICGRTIQTIERNVVSLLQRRDLFGPVVDTVHHTEGSTTARILGRTVHLIGAADATAEGRVRGPTIALAYVDEATLVPEAFWTMLVSRGRVEGARLLATTNPDGPAHWLRKKWLLRAADVDMRHWHFTLDDNPNLPAGYVERLKRQYVGLWYRRFIAGEWCLAEGAVYDMWDPDVHVVESLPPIRRWIGVGVDYGTVNPFAALLLGLGDDRRLYLAREWRYDSKLERRQLTDAEYRAKLLGWLDEVPVPGTDLRGVRPQYTAVDPSAASFVTELHRHGQSPVLADNAVLDGIRRMASQLGYERDERTGAITRPPNLRVHASCRGLIDEIGGYSWDPDKAEKGEDAPLKVDDHSLDAARYVLHTTYSAWRYDVPEAA